MMREKVCIVLNEREPAKARVAQNLELLLKDENITASRLKIDEHIHETIALRAPEVLILDYLIGDYSTGLDIMAGLQEKHLKDGQPLPRVVFLTDDPSVPVAVEAMRMGAADYFELSHPQAVDNTAAAVIAILAKLAEPADRVEIKKLPRLSDLIAHAPASLQLVERARTLVQKNSAIIVIYGPPGSGVSTLALAVARERPADCFPVTIDLRTFTANFNQYLGLAATSTQGVNLGRNLSVIVEHAEEDGGELLDLIASEYTRAWTGQHSRSNKSFLTVCTSDNKTAKAWGRLTGADQLTIQPLNARKEDIPALTQHFVKQAEELSGKRLKAVDAAVIGWLASLDWPGNVRQLWSVIVDAAIMSSFNEMTSLKNIIEEARSRWEQETAVLDSSDLVDSYTAAMILEQSSYSYRVAAAKIGCSISRLQQLLAAGAAS